MHVHTSDYKIDPSGGPSILELEKTVEITRLSPVIIASGWEAQARILLTMDI